MGGRRRYTEEDRVKALALRQTMSVREAANALGIPFGTVASWCAKQSEQTNKQTANKRPSKKLKAVSEQVVTRAVEKASNALADEAKAVASRLLALSSQAIEVAAQLMEEGPKEKEPRGLFLRSVVGVLAQSVEKHQLLTGKPTAHQQQSGEVTTRHEYDIRQEIINNPDARATANQLFERLAGATGGVRMAGEQPQMDTCETPATPE